MVQYSGIIALCVFIGITVLLNVFLKRQISEALLVALIACALVGGSDAPELLKAAVFDAAQKDIIFAGMAFVFMSAIINYTGMINRFISILDSIFGRLRGGSAYVSTLGSAAIGLVAGSTAGNTATVGSVTIPWMKRTGWSSERTATLVAGNSGLGVALPPNSTMLILLALPISKGVATGDLYTALLAAGGYAVLYRMVLVWIWTRRDNIQPTAAEYIRPFRQTWREGWSSTLIIMGIVIPVLLTFGPVYDWLNVHMGQGSLKPISIIVWVPILITLIAVVEGWNRLPRTRRDALAMVKKEIPQFATVGVSLFAALAATSVMENLGAGDQLAGLLNSLHLPKPAMIAIICVLVVLVATPLSSTATVTAVGVPAMAALSALGVPLVTSMVVILLCSSTEGASPPAGAPIYLASGMAEADPKSTFVPLIVFFVFPMMALAWLIGMQWLPL